MSRLSVAKVSLPLPIDREFDYRIPSDMISLIKIGMRVNVIFGRKASLGYVVGLSKTSKIKDLKPIVSLVDRFPILTRNNIELAKSVKDHYICSLGEALEMMLPHGLRENRGIEFELSCTKINKKIPNITYLQNFNEENTFTFLISQIKSCIAKKQKVIFLVPEFKAIERIEQMISKINNISIGLWHGKLSKNEFIKLWQLISYDKIDILIGTRSAVFAPLNSTGLVIIYDEDNYAYKDDQVPYYHTNQIAFMRSKIEKSDLVLTSIIPSEAIYKDILDKAIKVKKLEKDKSLPEIEIAGLNFKDKIDFTLEKEIERTLENKEKILILLDRKGFSTFIFCNNCKKILKCDRCSGTLRLDYASKKLFCPYCSFKKDMVEICPECNSSYVNYGGYGIEKLESIISRIFPQAKIITLDDSQNSKQALDLFDIIISTRKIIGEFNFKPGLTIIWNLDNMLNIGNYNLSEDVFILLSNLLKMTKRKMIISSTLGKEFYIIKSLEGFDYKSFYKTEFKTRKDLNIFPYTHIALISIRSKSEAATAESYKRLSKELRLIKSKKFYLSNPYSNLRSKLRGKFYKYLMVKSNDIELLNETLKRNISKFRTGSVIITVDIDPL